MPKEAAEISSKLYSSREVKDLVSIETKPLLQTGVSYLDRDFGFPSGYYLIVGNPGVGKSWFALWLSRVFYNNNGMQSVYFSLEMPEPLVRQRLLQQWDDLTKEQSETTPPSSRVIELLRKDVIVVDEFYAMETLKQTPKNFEEWIDEYYTLGYRIFHFDHFHELQGASVNESNQSAVQKWGLTFQQIAKKYPDIWLFIYGQPNSSDKKILRRSSLMGSKALTYKCDYFLSLNKNIPEDNLETGSIIGGTDDRVVLYIDKTRYTTKTHIGFALTFLPTGNFNSVSGDI